jgi:large conductance mechanosensitive channel
MVLLIKQKITIMKMIDEFKAFAMRGNVVDMAVGIIIGGAFGKIISSVVADIIMPPIGLLMGGVSFTDLKFILKDPVMDAAGKVTTQAVSINYGNFLQVTVDFLIIAFAIFMMIKAMNSLKKKEVPAPVVEPVAPAPSNEEVLLAEIRDLLKTK